MSNYHVMEGRRDGSIYEVVFHIPIPVENNPGGVSLRASLAEDDQIRYHDTDPNPKKSRVPWITAAEQTQLDNGELFEHAESYRTHPANTGAQDQAALDARFTALSTSVLNRLRTRYKFWRFDRDVP